MKSNLLERYNVAVPRYTSYPAVPDWESKAPSYGEWMATLNQNIALDPEISLYIHLPFCEQLCTYCACNKRITKNHDVESPYIDSVINEWQTYLRGLDHQPIIKELHLGGGTPTFFSPIQLDRLISAILSKVDVSAQRNFAFEAHPNSTTKEHLEVLYEHGFRRISVGVQDVNEDILKAINRYQTQEQVEELTRSAREIGYTSVNYDIIYGLPFQDIDHIEKTMAFVKEQRPDRIAFYSYAHVPWKSKGQRAFTELDLAIGKEKQLLNDKGEELLIATGYETIGMDHFALSDEALYISQQQDKLHRNFMGFTEYKTRCLIGLGNSAISDCTEMYVQNEKTVEDYKLSVDSGRLPLIKGHHLSPEQIKTREHILDLICNGRTRFKNDILDQRLFQLAKDKLDDLCRDGIISLALDEIKVTEVGQPFVRNVCASIDPLYNNSLALPRYSKAI